KGRSPDSKQFLSSLSKAASAWRYCWKFSAVRPGLYCRVRPSQRFSSCPPSQEQASRSLCCLFVPLDLDVTVSESPIGSRQWRGILQVVPHLSCLGDSYLTCPDWVFQVCGSFPSEE